MKPVAEIQIFVVQRDKNICYQTCRKTHEKKTVIASLFVCVADALNLLLYRASANKCTKSCSNPTESQGHMSAYLIG